MNLGDLWSGSDYAYFPRKGRGETYRPRAYRVKIIRTYKEQLYGNERMSGFAEVLECDNETGEPLENPDGSHKIRKVKARDIALHWAEYADLHEQKEAEREVYEAEWRKRDEERRAHYAEQDRIRQEQERIARLEREEALRIERERIEREQAAIKEYLTSKGIPVEAIHTIGSEFIYVDRKVIQNLCLAQVEGF